MRSHVAIPLALLLALLVGPQWMQGQTSQITGRVTDPSEAVIPGASVTVLNEQTGVERTVTTNELGYYTAPLLTRGNYEVRVEATGFRAAARRGQNLDEGQILRLDFALEVGQVSEVVEVQGAAPLLQTEDTSLTTVITQRSVTDLPLNQRNPQALAALVPGVRPIGDFGGAPISSWAQSAIAIGGGAPGANNFQVDGIAAENFASGGLQTFLSVDATEEFRIITRNPSAEYGRTGGGVMNFVSKSGTNEFHGGAYWFHRNRALNANAFFSNRAGVAKSPFVYNQFGGTFGGPIQRDKTFFFFHYEEFRERTEARTIRTLPTDLQRQGDFSQTFDSKGNLVAIHDPLTTAADPSKPGNRIRGPFPGNVIPANRIHPVSAAVTTFYPNPTDAGDPLTGTSNFFNQASRKIDQRQYGIKIDHHLTASRRISVRYTNNRTDDERPDFFGNEASPDGGPVIFERPPTAINYTDSLRPNLLLEAKAGVNAYNVTRQGRSTGFDYSRIKLPARLNGQTQVQLFPEFRPSDVSMIGDPSGQNFKQTNWTWNYGGSLLWIKGAHTIKFGGEHRIYQHNINQGGPNMQYVFARNFTRGPNPNNTATNSGHGFATFLLGTPTSGRARRWPTRTYTAHYTGFYVQDDWKVTPKLTLNLGLRYELDLAVTDRFDAISNFDPDFEFEAGGVTMRGAAVFPGTGGLSRGHRDNWYRDFGPRFGFAYKLAEQTVVRGGYGIYYIPATGSFRPGQSGFSANTDMIASADGGFTPYHTLDDPFPGGVLLPAGSSLGPLTALGTSVEGNVRSLARHYSQQWNFNIQHQLPANWIVELGYAGNRGVHLAAPIQYDFLDERYRSLGTALQEQVANPFYGVIQGGALSLAKVSRGTLLDNYPQFTGNAVAVDSWASSIYHAMTLRVEKRFSQGFSLLGAYTWSKLIDDNLGNGANSRGVFIESGSNGVQNWNNRRAERAVSTSDQPHRLTLTGLWELPFGKGGPRLYQALAGGWQINSMVTITSGDVISITQAGVPFGGNRPNVAGDPNVDNPTIDRWFNTDAFELISAFTFGNVARNLPRTRTDGLFNWDFSVLKDVAITEQVKLQLRGEFFNFTNTPTFGNPNGNASAGAFGRVTAAASSPRQIQVGAKIVF